jgi:hypothetical protein
MVQSTDQLTDILLSISFSSVMEIATLQVFRLSIVSVVALIMAATSRPAYSQSVCQKLDGQWVGSMSGRFTGPTSMTIADCQVTWRLPDGRTNYCTFTASGGGLGYSCTLGSRGTVSVSGNRITMKNTFTGNDYTVSLRKS